MSNFILDTSILVQHIITDIHTGYVEVFFEEVGETISIHVPEFCILECTNVLWKQVRFNGVSPEAAAKHVKDLQSIELTIAPVIGLMPRALEVGLKHKLSESQDYENA